LSGLAMSLGLLPGVSDRADPKEDWGKRNAPAQAHGA
jgi:hypothetical protein